MKERIGVLETEGKGRHGEGRSPLGGTPRKRK